MECKRCQGISMTDDKAILSVLIVEDEWAQAEQLQATVQSLGHRVTAVATTGHEALKAVQAQLPHVMVVDIHLNDSDMDGIEIARAVWANWAMPVIFLTSLRDTMTRKRANKEGASIFMSKPLSRHALKTELEGLFQGGIQLPTSRLPLVQDALILHKLQVVDQAVVPLGQIVRLAAGRSYCDVYYFNATKQLVKHVEDKPMGHLLAVVQQKPSGNSFMQIHRSHVVNMQYVEGKAGNGLLLKNGDTVPISKKYRQAIDMIFQ